MIPRGGASRRRTWLCSVSKVFYRLEAFNKNPTGGCRRPSVCRSGERLCPLSLVLYPVRGRSAPQEAYNAGRPRGRGLPPPLAWSLGFALGRANLRRLGRRRLFDARHAFFNGALAPALHQKTSAAPSVRRGVLRKHSFFNVTRNSPQFRRPPSYLEGGLRLTNYY